MSRLKELLRVAPPSTCNTQQDRVHACKGVAQQVHTAQQAGVDVAFSDQLREFEALLAIVAPVYKIPVPEYADIRDSARRDIKAALQSYRAMAERSGAKSIGQEDK